VVRADDQAADVRAHESAGGRRSRPSANRP
jgi:hypothetical protein